MKVSSFASLTRCDGVIFGYFLWLGGIQFCNASVCSRAERIWSIVYVMWYNIIKLFRSRQITQNCSHRSTFKMGKQILIFFFFESLPFASTCTFLTSRAANTIIKKREATASFPYNLLSMRLAKGKLHIYCTRIALINLGQIVVEHEKTHWIPPVPIHPMISL